jgi:hypothetical protein
MIEVAKKVALPLLPEDCICDNAFINYSVGIFSDWNKLKEEILDNGRFAGVPTNSADCQRHTYIYTCIITFLVYL